MADSLFRSLVAQRVRCSCCGKVTHCIAPRMEHQVPISTPELRQLAVRHPGACMEQLLAGLMREHKACDRDVKGCGKVMVSRCVLCCCWWS
jgi:hypothetical protein